MSSAEASTSGTYLSPGEQIHTIRRRTDVTIQDIADELGVHRNTVARWERPGDPSEPSVSQARVIAKMLGVPLEQIAGGAELLLPTEYQQPELELFQGGKRQTTLHVQRPFRALGLLQLVRGE